MSTHHAGCLICGAALVYGAARSSVCALCGGQLSADVACAAGHFVCDRCHGASAFDVIEQRCAVADETDAQRLALELMRSPAVHLHGPEHHFLVPAVLLTAWCNVRGVPAEERRRLLAEARRRAELVKGGFCGNLGACGAAVGAGIFVSLVTGATPLTGKSWRLSNLATAGALARIADAGGPRCCKRCTGLALDTALDFAVQHLGTELPRPALPRCEHHGSCRECLRTHCPLYPGA